MKENVKLIQDSLAKQLNAEVTVESEEVCSKWLEKEEQYIIGFGIEPSNECLSSDKTLVIFAIDEEDELFCKIANGVLKDITPELSDSYCELLLDEISD